MPDEIPQINTIRDVYSPEECKENEITFEEVKKFQDRDSDLVNDDNKFYYKDPLGAPLTPSSDKSLEITNLFIVDQKPENDNEEEGEKSVEIDEMLRAPTYDARPKFSILDRIVNRHKPLRTEMEVAEDSDEDFEGSDLNRTKTRMLKGRRHRVSNQDDSLQSSSRRRGRAKRAWVVEVGDKNEEESSLVSDVSLTLANNQEKAKTTHVLPQTALKPAASRFGELILGSILKSNTNVHKPTTEEEKKNVIFSKIRALGKKFQGKGKVIVSTSTRQQSNPLKALKSNIATKFLDKIADNAEKSPTNNPDFKELDDYLLDREETKKPSKFNREYSDSISGLEEVVDSLSDSSVDKSRIKGPLAKRRQSVRVRNSKIVDTSKIMLSKSQELQEHAKVESFGDPVFRDIITTITEETKDQAPKVAAEYYKLAFRDIKLFHFKENSCTKQVYFTRSHTYTQEFMTLVCWLYLMISFLEPSHSTDNSIERTDRQFIITTSCEAFILAVFVVDMLFKIYFRIVSSKSRQSTHTFWDRYFIADAF